MSTFSALAEKLRDAKVTLVAKKKPLVNERAELCAERHTLEITPVPAKDARDLLLALIDRKADSFAATAGISEIFDRVLYPPMIAVVQKRPWRGSAALNQRDIGAILSGNSAALGEQSIFGGIADIEGALCYFLSDAIKAKLTKEWNAHAPTHREADASRVGPPTKERRTRLQTIDARLTEIAAECASLDQEAADLGIELPAVDLVEPNPLHFDRDTAIVTDNAQAWNGHAVCELYGLSPEYAEYLQRKSQRGELGQGDVMANAGR